MLDEDPEIWVPVPEPADFHSVDIEIRLRLLLLLLLLFPKKLSKWIWEKGLLSSANMRNYSWKIPPLNFSNFINKGMFIKQSPALATDMSKFEIALVAVEMKLMHRFESRYYSWVEQGPTCGNQETKIFLVRQRDKLWDYEWKHLSLWKQFFDQTIF